MSKCNLAGLCGRTGIGIGLVVGMFAACTSSETGRKIPAGISPDPGKAEWIETDLGTQITTVNILSGDFRVDSSGAVTAFATLYGDPCRLAAIDVGAKRVSRVLDLPGGACGVYATVLASDGNLYLGSNPNGHLYRYRPGSDRVEDLGQVGEATTFVWDMVEGKGGKLYAGTYPKGKVVSYDMVSGQFHDYGPMLAPEDYVRSIACDPSTGTLYAGIGAHAGLIQLNPDTGEKRNILPAEYKTKHFVYALDVAGGKLIAKLEPSMAALVIDLKTGVPEAILQGLQSVHTSPLSPRGDAFYYYANETLYRYDLQTMAVESLGISLGGTPVRFAFARAGDGRDPILYAVCKGGYICMIDPVTRQTEEVHLEMPRQPVNIQSLLAGPDGKIYTSGYLSGGVGVYRPETGQSVEFTGVGQAEGITSLGSRIYFGVYPKARICIYDTASPWNPRAGNPKEVFSLDRDDQDRPFGMLGVEQENKVFIGTVPSYGLLGGALAVFDVATSRTQVYRNLIPGQSIITLTYGEGEVYGGTTISGGLGIPPIEREGRFFVWDVAKGEKICDLVPVAGMKAVTSVAFARDGNVWGWAEGTLFIFDPRQQKVIYAERKLPVDYSGATHIYRVARMIDGNDGYLYGTLDSRFFRISLATRDLEVLREGKMILLDRGQDGSFYFARDSHLIRVTRQ